MKALLLLLALGGDDKKSVDVVCPVDGFKFTAVEIVSTNDWGGVDRDFCRHAYKTRPMDSYVWVCPSCKFAGRKKDFEAKLEDSVKAALKKDLKPLVEIRKGMKQADIAGYVKYDLLAQAERLRGTGQDAIARAYLMAAWWHRQAGAVYLEDFDEFTALFEKYSLHKTPLDLGKKNRTEYELEIAKKIEKDVSGGVYRGLNLFLAKYLVAYLYRKHGENVEALKWLEDLKGSKTENSVIDEGVKAMLTSIEKEREFQKQARAELEAAFAAGKLEKKALAEMAYVIGEIHRRGGDRSKAAEWYQKAIDGTPDEALKKLATEQRDLPK